MRHDKNPCIGCSCYDPDMGCTMPSCDMNYACPLESKTTEFFMPMRPPTKTHQQKEVKITWNKKKKKYIPIFYEPAELKAVRIKLQEHLSQHVPEEKYTEAVRLITKWSFPITGNRKDGQYKTTKPDTDNLQKMLKDVMTDLGYWTDDALVASEITEKFWAKIPGIYIKIEEV